MSELKAELKTELHRELKPYQNSSVQIPGELHIEANGTIDTLKYPHYGSPEDKLVYLRIMNELRMNSCIDESIIC